MIGSNEFKIYAKMLRNLSENSEAKLPATALSYPVAKTASLHDVFSEMFKLKASSVEGESMPQKGKKRRKQKAKNNFKKN